jgi:hypothetical protein
MNQTVLLAFVIAVGIVVLLPRIMMRHIAGQALSEVGKRALARVPEQISLSRNDEAPIKNRSEVEAQVGLLLEAGFKDLGTYSVDKMPGVHIRMLHHPETSVAAHIYDHTRVGSWIEFASRYADGTSHTLTTLPPTGLEHPSWVRMIRADQSIATDQLYQQFLKQRDWHNIKPVSAEEVVREFEEGYLRIMIWRQNSGITPEEVAKVALKWMKKSQAQAAGTIG